MNKITHNCLLSRELTKLTFQRMSYSQQKAIIDGLATNSTVVALTMVVTVLGGSLLGILVFR